MQVIYHSIDDVDFYTRDDCLRHERNLTILKMYDASGNRTEIAGTTYVVYFDDTSNDDFFDKSASDYFINLCEQQGSDFSGIDSDSLGWYYWDSKLARYVHLSDDIYGIFKKIIKEKE